MQARMKILDVMPLYLFLCDISCHMHHGFTLSHTHAPHGCNDLGGGLLYVLVCAIDIWGHFMNSNHKHILRESLS